MHSREACVAGSFYPKKENEIWKMLSGFFAEAKKEAGNAKNSCNAVVSPHAGWIYSGKTCAKAINALKKRNLYIIISPNHTGLGERISIYPAGEWITPLGKIKVNSFAVEFLAKKLGIQPDELAHIGEHSIEVILPFLQHLNSEAKTKKEAEFEFAAITLMEHEFKELELLANALAELFKKTPFSLIASSDFTHFESEKEAEKKDKKAIELIEKLKGKEFHEMVLNENLSICGFAPITTAIEFSKKTGAKKAELIEYTSSAKTTKNAGNVVAYAAIKFR